MSEIVGIRSDYVIQAVVVLILVYVIVDDIRNYRIRNVVVVLLGLLFLPWCIVRGSLALFLGHLAFAAVMFAILMVLYARRMMGGGDVKLLTVAFLWLGTEGALPFSIVLTGLALAYIAVARMGWLPMRSKMGRSYVPYGPSIAGAWIATVALLLNRE